MTHDQLFKRMDDWAKTKELPPGFELVGPMWRNRGRNRYCQIYVYKDSMDTALHFKMNLTEYLKSREVEGVLDAKCDAAVGALLKKEYQA